MILKKLEMMSARKNDRITIGNTTIRCAFTMMTLPRLMRGFITMEKRHRCRHPRSIASGATGYTRQVNMTSGSITYEKSIQHTMDAMRATPVVLCIREDDSTSAYHAAAAAIHGGLTCIEMTLTTPDAISIIRKLQTEHPHTMIGAGTVLTIDDVEAVADAGAAFAMSPATDASIIRAAHNHGMLAIPGAATPTEVWRAYYHAGARIVKIFPVAFCGGLDFIRALKGPLPQVPLLPTSGVPTEQAEDYLSESNVFAVGVSRQIVTREAVQSRNWDIITQRAQVWAEIAAHNNIP